MEATKGFHPLILEIVYLLVAFSENIKGINSLYHEPGTDAEGAEKCSFSLLRLALWFHIY
jgi:hypothetical protein